MLLVRDCWWCAVEEERVMRGGSSAAAELAKEEEGERREEWDKTSMQAMQAGMREGGGGDGSEMGGS